MEVYVSWIIAHACSSAGVAVVSAYRCLHVGVAVVSACRCGCIVANNRLCEVDCFVTALINMRL